MSHVDPGCAVPDCGRLATSLGLCNRHYQYARRHGLHRLDAERMAAAVAAAYAERQARADATRTMARHLPMAGRCSTKDCAAASYSDQPWCFPHWLDALKTSPGWADLHPDGPWPWEREGLTPAAWAMGLKSATERSVA